MHRRFARQVLITLTMMLAFWLAPSAVAEEVVHFKSGSTMPIVSHQIKDGMVYVDLGEESEIAFPLYMVERIEAGNNRAIIRASANKRQTPTPEGSYPVKGTPRRKRGELIEEVTPPDARVVIDERSGRPVYKPFAGSGAANKARFGAYGNQRAMRARDETGRRNVVMAGAPDAAGGLSQATPFGQRNSVGRRTDRRGRLTKKPPIVNATFNPAVATTSESSGGTDGGGGDSGAN